MNNYTEEELKVLNKVAEDIYGGTFDELDMYEQDHCYCMAEEMGLFD